MVNDKYKENFSNKLNYYMGLKGKKQADIIKDLNINKSAISSWCNGTRLPRMGKVEQLANYLDISISDLIGNDAEPNNNFEFVVNDDAMFPLLDIGDIAFIDGQRKIESGQTYLINLEGNKTIRKIIYNKPENNYDLLGMNTYCKPINISAADIFSIEILGKVVKAENTSAFKLF